MKRLSASRKGFSLIELMVVVAIIAILAAIAIPQYKKFQLKSKTVEAKTNIGAIVTAEESFAAENGQYAQCSAAPYGVTPGPTKHPWRVRRRGAGFDLIGFKPAGDVYYVYGVTSGTPRRSAAAGRSMANDATRFRRDTYVDRSGNIRYGVLSREGRIDITIAATGDLDGNRVRAGFVRDDEHTKIVPDPVNAGTSEF